MGWWKETVDIARKNDPAARSSLEIIPTYPDTKALAAHCLSHLLWKHDSKLITRMHSRFWCFWTQIETRPRAEVAEGILIDHGSGLVIGETAIVEKGVVLYHGVTPGRISKDVGKRYPTVCEGTLVSVYAQVIGPIETGKSAKVGAAAAAVADVPADVTVIDVPAKVVRVHGKKDVDAIHNMEENRGYYTPKLEEAYYQSLYSSKL